MRRGPIVVGATGAGLAALLSFHTTSLSGPTGPLVSASGPGTGGSGTGGSGTGTSPGTTPPATGPAPTATSPTTTRAPSTEAPTTTAPGTPSAATGSPTTEPTTGPSTRPTGPASPTTPSTAAPTPTTRAPTTTTTQGTRRADGQDVFYRYGELELQVTISGGRITDVEPVVDNATDSRSAQINDQAIPDLRQQALQAQSSNIDGVSGATYTSNAYVQSLQAALDKLGWKQ